MRGEGKAICNLSDLTLVLPVLPPLFKKMLEEPLANRIGTGEF